MFFDRIFSVTPATFNPLSLEIFKYQYENAEVYNLFCQTLKKNPGNVKTIDEIPFLPIELFKTHIIKDKNTAVEKVFESSGTTGITPSRHYVASLETYERSFINCFKTFYGPLQDYVILALLPSYLERDNSSLVYMADKLIQLTGKSESGFFLNEFTQLHKALNQLKQAGQKTILLGVTFALLDFAENYAINFPELIVMETGGMKGRREELTRAEVHERLCPGFGVTKIHSEYGMTELLSQAYSKGNGIFEAPPWMKVLCRDVYDPLKTDITGMSGALNVIDLANIHSCSFIATGDLVKMNLNGTFEIAGRVDNAEIRGCNLMVA
jgi:phenylacetate-coenzyme A ligase PaaK-like adenylate-forming protein